MIEIHTIGTSIVLLVGEPQCKVIISCPYPDTASIHLSLFTTSGLGIVQFLAEGSKALVLDNSLDHPMILASFKKSSEP